MYLDEELRKKIKKTLDDDGIIAFVTDTVWGLGCLPSSELAVKKIYEIKKREASKPLILMSNSVENLKPYIKKISKKADKLIQKYFPGALTLVFEKTVKAPDYLTSGLNTVGLRVPENAIFKEICEVITRGVLATTSANVSNEPAVTTYEEAIEKMDGKVDLIIRDFGCDAKGLESTVAIVNEYDIKVLRQGVVYIETDA